MSATTLVEATCVHPRDNLRDEIAKGRSCNEKRHHAPIEFCEAPAIVSVVTPRAGGAG
jgi:hypothetical protein